MKLETALLLVKKEVVFASENYRPIKSAHEGYAIIKEEFDELWEAVKKIKNPDEINVEMEIEAIHTAAMCVRFLMDLIK